MQKLWGGRFSKQTDTITEDFTASVQFDYRLASYDIQGSIAHTRMLKKCGILTESEESLIVEGLNSIHQDILANNFLFDPKLEDVHMNIEYALIRKIGEVGKKLHTARSRNDQITLDMRLYLLWELKEIITLIRSFQSAILLIAEKNIEAIMPGHTHLQHAEPVLFSHHIMAYFWMFERDMQRFADCLKRINILPLGACALAGTSLPIDREYTASLLDFPGITENSIDTVSDRDYILEFSSVASICMMHLSRLSEEIILWSTHEYRWVDIDESFCTGSSIMPQKKNPDMCELTRGKTGRVYGNLFSLFTIMKSLPLAYNRDMQEDKEPLFDTVDTLKQCLGIYDRLISSLKINTERMRLSLSNDFSWATEMANYLVQKGIPFRDAHHIVGKIVAANRDIMEFTLEELKEFSELFENNIFEVTKPEYGINQKNSAGGTSCKQVKEQIEQARKLVTVHN
ncbi:argininosuccinate lyase [Candidatus Desantisbacteria bacterium CG2_30_40_21]|uniref:Argininosuccinate lyase n=4 Tax=unclassified Candidatus Desantisiibacteriota TaxID=3106372 RepID=A0A2M7JB37_9BACT|nr:MAG: argininosuccinate lyase [Candidatus Desantisbacteria bacterium CG2_30_40_21]PIX16608.1 MAG: argininosuccinate lyase [Candidatus Desantisbacteria bacterium CG_4_8_14_3_um_filter_40_12]PJB29381.1 MAG: argininosuccinate lyase [Candidatus Desantisbacteria bacterium CG_4_9_14_3_um_filter_40_11]